MEKVEAVVEGMTCSTCALSVTKYLEKQGFTDINVNVAGGNVSFIAPSEVNFAELKKGINKIGYKILEKGKTGTQKKAFLSTHLQRFFFCLPFTLLLMLHMLPWHGHLLMHPVFQLLCCLPVFIVGMWYFGSSALKSILSGVPNMNVLIALGAASAFIYSVMLMISPVPGAEYFFESAATIITIVFLGYWIEHRSVLSTQKELQKLRGTTQVIANMIAYDQDHAEQIFPLPANQLRKGDLILMNTGDQVPADCKILWGTCLANESFLTGESLPVVKNPKDLLLGGSIINDGTVKAQVTAAENEGVLSSIITLAEKAQSAKPPIQKLADKISSIFVPAVLLIALTVFFLNKNMVHLPTSVSLLRAIAVLVIACPCAMGIATPAAIAVGLARAARNGILYKNPTVLQLFSNIRQVVFDKTGTLTTGKFIISSFESFQLPEEEFKHICSSLEKYSNHPIARAVYHSWKTATPYAFSKVHEIKGVGITGIDKNGDEYKMGAALINEQENNSAHNIFVYKNNALIGWIDLTDELRPEAAEVIQYFKKRNIRTFLISGDHLSKCQSLSDHLAIDTYYAERTPQQKAALLHDLNSLSPTLMIGDGINDAAALATATIGISISDASELARQHAHVILLNSGIAKLPLAIQLGRHTYLTIKQNLFWAFIYNILAIPVAAFGFLTPGIAAFAMGFSDVILAINSLRLKWKRVI